MDDFIPKAGLVSADQFAEWILLDYAAKTPRLKHLHGRLRVAAFVAV